MNLENEDTNCYTSISKLAMQGTEPTETPDFSTILVSMTSGAQKLWDKEFKPRTNPKNNVVKFTVNGMNLSQKTYYYKLLAQFFNVKLVKRIDSGIFMVNPHIIIPLKNVKALQKHWDSL